VPSEKVEQNNKGKAQRSKRSYLLFEAIPQVSSGNKSSENTDNQKIIDTKSLNKTGKAARGIIEQIILSDKDKLIL